MNDPHNYNSSSLEQRSQYSDRIAAASGEIVKHAVMLLKAGHLVAIPTETVYGLAAIATSKSAINRLYKIKNRPLFNPLIIHVASIDQARELGEFNDHALKLAKKFWPGPLTLVTPLAANAPVHPDALANLKTIALRMPSHPLIRQIIAATGTAIAAPSANKSGRTSPTRAVHVDNDFKDCPEPALIIDGGDCTIGIESTIVACISDIKTCISDIKDHAGSDGAILRPGSITKDQIAAAIAQSPSAPNQLSFADNTISDTKIIAPGNLKSHYSPEAMVRLNATTVMPGEAVITFADFVPAAADNAVKIINLSPDGDLDQAAAGFYHALRILDQLQPKAIAVTTIPNTGTGIAINDRLARAASPN